MKKCEHIYHDDTHPDLCVFEQILDNYLVPDKNLTINAIELRTNLILGVRNMYNKVKKFEQSQPNATPLLSEGERFGVMCDCGHSIWNHRADGCDKCDCAEYCQSGEPPRKQ